MGGRLIPVEGAFPVLVTQTLQAQLSKFQEVLFICKQLAPESTSAYFYLLVLNVYCISDFRIVVIIKLMLADTGDRVA